MRVRCRLSVLMGERKLRIADVCREAGLPRSTVTALYHETAERVELGAVARLCAFFDCGVGDLLYLEP